MFDWGSLWRRFLIHHQPGDELADLMRERLCNLSNDAPKRRLLIHLTSGP